MTTGERLWLFVAIAPPAAVRSALGAAIDELRQICMGQCAGYRLRAFTSR